MLNKSPNYFFCHQINTLPFKILDYLEKKQEKIICRVKAPSLITRFNL
uniref:Uncharacterized protein n=1 Tax=Rhizophora mucronata TaxID=61149 RepID=A0A2P2NX65_RHIMU